MATVRVAPSKVGRLVRVSLNQVDAHHRAIVARRLREQRWEIELRPDVGYSPSMGQKLRALSDAVELERAVVFPHGTYLLPETAVDDVLAKHGAS